MFKAAQNYINLNTTTTTVSPITITTSLTTSTVSSKPEPCDKGKYYDRDFNICKFCQQTCSDKTHFIKHPCGDHDNIVCEPCSGDKRPDFDGKECSCINPNKYIDKSDDHICKEKTKCDKGYMYSNTNSKYGRESALFALKEK